jgi:hypothetical protein
MPGGFDMTKAPSPGRTYQKRVCVWVAALVCVVSVLFISVPVTYGTFGRPALKFATLFPYDRTDTRFMSRSVAIGKRERGNPVKTNTQFLNHRSDQFPRYHQSNKMMEMIMEWILQPLLYIFKKLKMLYVVLLILLILYVIYLNMHRGIHLLKDKYLK